MIEGPVDFKIEILWSILLLVIINLAISIFDGCPGSPFLLFMIISPRPTNGHSLHSDVFFSSLT